jgi:hypothetical protein
VAVPITAWVLVAFGLGYGWVLCEASRRGVYRVSGVRWVDAFVLSWVFGLAAAVTPLVLYLAFGFHEFSPTPPGPALLHRLRWLARAEVAFGVIYAVGVLLLVPQR